MNAEAGQTVVGVTNGKIFACWGRQAKPVRPVWQVISHERTTCAPGHHSSPANLGSK